MERTPPVFYAGNWLRNSSVRRTVSWLRSLRRFRVSLVRRWLCALSLFLLCAGAGAGATPSAGVTHFAGAPSFSGLTIYTEVSSTVQIVDANGNLTGGTGAELVWEIQKRIGDSTPIQVVPWARGYKAALETPNVMLFSTGRTAERENLFTWVGPIVNIRYSLVAKKSKNLKLSSLEDAKKLRSIGVVRADVREQLLLSRGFTNLEPVATYSQNVKKIEIDRIDAYASSNLGYGIQMREAGLNPDDYEEIFTISETELYMVFSRGTDPAQIERWKKGYASVVEDGTRKKILEAHYPHLQW